MSEEHPDLTLAYMTGYHKGREVAERDAKDAARYRHARINMTHADFLTSEQYDAEIDAAMTAESTCTETIDNLTRPANASKNEPKLNMTPLDDALTDKTDWIDGNGA